jgi:hypothetical protein
MSAVVEKGFCESTANTTGAAGDQNVFSCYAEIRCLSHIAVLRKSPEMATKASILNPKSCCFLQYNNVLKKKSASHSGIDFAIGQNYSSAFNGRDIHGTVSSFYMNQRTRSPVNAHIGRVGFSRQKLSCSR